MITTSDQLERFLAKADIPEDAENECWLWKGARNLQGYGKFAIRPKWYQAHRLSYDHFWGPIPAGMQIDHLCRNIACVNPRHLEPVTPVINQSRGKRGVLHTHCANGHLLDGSNIYWNRSGKYLSRDCQKCKTDARRRYRQRNPERVKELKRLSYSRTHPPTPDQP
jgi:hypothetical protein